MDLLTAELTSIANVELVERQEIERVIQERDLGSGSTDVAHAPRLGAGLNADALLLVTHRVIDQENVLEVRFVRVNPGIVLETRIFPTAGDMNELGRAISAGIPGLVEQSLRKEATAVSLVSVRSAVLSGGGAELERLLKPLLTQRLARHPDFVLLERAAMESLEREAQARFWTSRYLVRALIVPSQDGSGKFTLELSLETPDGKKSAKGQGAGTLADPLSALDTAISAITPRGSVPPAAASQEAEAAYFAEEAQIALRLREPGIALAAAEAAWALGRRDTGALRNRIEARVDFLEQKQMVFATPSSSAWGQNDPFRHPLRAADCPSPAEWVSTSVECLQLWNAGLTRIAPESVDERAAWLELFKKVQVNTQRAFTMLHTAKEMAQHSQALAGLARDWLHSLRVAQALAVDLRDVEKELHFTVPELRFARHLFPDPAHQLAAWRKILEREFVEHNAFVRAEIRSNLSLFRGIRHKTSVLRPILEDLRASRKPDDHFESIHQDPDIWRVGPKRILLQRELLKTFEGLAPSFIEDARLIPMFARKVRAHERWENRVDPEQPFVTAQNGTGKMEYSDEYRMTYRRVMLALFEKSKSIEGTEEWLQRDLFTEADLAAMAPAAQRWFEANSAESLPTGASTWLAALKLDPARQTRKRLAIRQSWHFDKVGGSAHAVQSQPLGLAKHHEGAMWLPISPGSSSGPDRAYYLAQITLPSLSTKLLKVPPSVEPDAKPAAWGNVFFHRDNVYLSWAGVGTYIYNRTAGTWTANKSFVPSLHTPAIHGDLAYQPIQQDGGGLLQWNLATGEATLLASARRSPGQTPLDDPRLAYRAVSVDAQGDVLVDMIERREGEPGRPKRFAWSPTTRQWREQPAEPFAEVKARAARTPRNGFLWGLAIAEGTTGPGRDRLTFQWRPDDPNEKGVPITIFEPDVTALWRSPDSGKVRAFACANGVFLETRQPSAGFWFISRADYDTFAEANGYDPMPLP